jgi:hypothetical protein
MSKALLVSPKSSQQFLHDVGFRNALDVRRAGLEEAAVEVEDRPFLRENAVDSEEGCAVAFALVGRERIVAAGETVALEEVELLEVARFVS